MGHLGGSSQVLSKRWKVLRKKRKMTREYREKIETKLGHICDDVLSLLEKLFFLINLF